MKNIGAMIAAAILLAVPAGAFAASVQVYPTITNAHGGTRFASSLSTTITYTGGSQSQSGVPTYDLGAGPVDYTVTADSYAGYSATLDSGCAGTAQDGATVVCNIDWQDGAPIVETLPAAPVPQQVVQAPAQQVSTSPATQTITLPTDVTASSTLSEADQIVALQAQIMQLYQILIALLEQKLAVLQQ